MLTSSGIIKKAMNERGFKHRQAEEQFSIRGEYARNLQYVYSKEHHGRGGTAVDLVYFSVDILNEKLVIGFFREIPLMENGVLINSTRLINLQNFTVKELGLALDKLIPTSKDKLK